MARQTSPSPLGAYLDIILDFIIYAAFVLVFSLQNEINLLAGAFLLFSYICTGTTFLTQLANQQMIGFHCFEPTRAYLEPTLPTSKSLGFIASGLLGPTSGSIG